MLMDERNDSEPNQSRGKKADAEKHDWLNHGPYASNSSALVENQGIHADRPRRRRSVS